MTIKECLQKGPDIRVSYGGGRWMFWNGDSWQVMEKKPYAKKVRILVVTENEEEAIAALIEGDEEYFNEN